MDILFYFRVDLPIILVTVFYQHAIALLGLAECVVVGHYLDCVIWVIHLNFYVLFIFVKIDVTWTGISTQLHHDYQVAIILRHGPHGKLHFPTLTPIQHSLKIMLNILNTHFLIIIDPNHTDSSLITTVGIYLTKIFLQIYQLISYNQLSWTILFSLYRLHHSLVCRYIVLFLQQIF